jgi:hypothetical protein
MYKDKHSITDIIPDTKNNLSICVDQDIGETEKYPVLLFTPYLSNKNNHYHIPLTREQAVELLIWLQSYLQDTTK